jgi:hypothetical protein
MSHFAVLVIGKNPEKQLAPFNETLKKKWVDKTKEYKEEYETIMVDEFYCSSSSSWGQQITKELFEKISGSEVGSEHVYEVKKFAGLSYFKENKKYCGYHELPNHKRCEGDAWFEVVKVLETTHPDREVCFEGKILIRVIAPPKEMPIKVKYPDYDTYLKDWHGVNDVTKQGYWTNPQGKWDWHELGGRWTGYFKMKPQMQGVVGSPGLMTPVAEVGYADQALKKEIDFEGMRAEAVEKAEKAYDKAMQYIGHLPVNEKWETVRERFTEEGKSVEDAREYYWAQERCKAWEKLSDRDFRFGYEVDSFTVSKEEYVKRAKDSAVSTFAVVKDGKWYSRGEMGWWGVVSDEKDKDKWNDEFNKLIDSLSDDTMLSLYDCHC